MCLYPSSLYATFVGRKMFILHSNNLNLNPNSKNYCTYVSILNQRADVVNIFIDRDLQAHAFYRTFFSWIVLYYITKVLLMEPYIWEMEILIRWNGMPWLLSLKWNSISIAGSSKCSTMCQIFTLDNEVHINLSTAVYSNQEG